MFQQALRADPNHAPSYAMLALCWMRDEKKTAQAVDAAKRAVALEPEDAFPRGVLALAVASGAREGQNSVLEEARVIASHAVQLDPDSDFASTVEAQIYLQLRKHPEAEVSARRALERNIDNTMAAEILSAALLLQHKDEDNASLIQYQLQNNPDDDSSHASAGWQALAKGDHRGANKHFLEALRLNPMNEGARVGLLESFRARSWVYSLYLRFCHAMDRFSERTGNAIMIGGFIAFQILRGALKNVSPFWTSALVAVWITLALWSHLARGFGSFFMIFDGFARRALKPKELGEGLAVGGVTVVALGLLLASFAGWQDLAVVSLVFFFSAVVSAAAFTNRHYTGKYVYAVAAGVAGIGALVVAAGILLQLDIAIGSLVTLVLITGVAVSWLRPLRVLYA